MNQRGQFYLIAALITVAVLLGTGIVFTHARVPQNDPSVAALAEEMRDETYQLINRDAFQGNTSEQTWRRIEGLSQNYSLFHPRHEIIIFYGNYTKLMAKSYLGGVESTITSGLEYNSSTITFVYGPSTYTFYRSYGNEYHVWIKKEGENGKTVATR
ncbi:MAG: hypothetical protein AABY00_03155 [Nanoarchaeota archaeon]